MSTAALLLLLWLAFSLAHIWPTSSSVRPRLVKRFGSGLYLALYSLVSLAIFVPLVWLYLGNLHQGPQLWDLGSVPVLREVVIGVNGLAFTLIVASFFQPSPFSLGAPRVVEPRGLLRITRHPLFMPVVPLALGHLLLYGHATDVAFFGGLTLYTVLGCAHQDRRQRSSGGDRLARFFESSSLFPFVAILLGRNRLVLRELPWLGLLIGAAAAYGFYFLHPVMFA